MQDRLDEIGQTADLVREKHHEVIRAQVELTQAHDRLTACKARFEDAVCRLAKLATDSSGHEQKGNP